MIQHIYAVPRFVIEMVLKNGSNDDKKYPWFLISIHSMSELINDSNFEKLQSLGCLKYISLGFHDINDRNEFVNAGLTIFNKDQAKTIIEFLKYIKEFSIDTNCNLIIHCDAGVCRSGAVATFASEYLNHSDIIFKRDNPSIYPNSYVLKVLEEVNSEII